MVLLIDDSLVNRRRLERKEWCLVLQRWHSFRVGTEISRKAGSCLMSWCRFHLFGNWVSMMTTVTADKLVSTKICGLKVTLQLYRTRLQLSTEIWGSHDGDVDHRFVMSCGLVGGYQRFGGTHRLHPQGSAIASQPRRLQELYFLSCQLAL
jgi:hypothetical protein